MQLRRLHQSAVGGQLALLEIAHKRIPCVGKPFAHLALQQRSHLDGVSAELGAQTFVAHRERVQSRLREALDSVSRVRERSARRDAHIPRARDHSQPRPRESARVVRERTRKVKSESAQTRC